MELSRACVAFASAASHRQGGRLRGRGSRFPRHRATADPELDDLLDEGRPGSAQVRPSRGFQNGHTAVRLPAYSRLGRAALSIQRLNMNMMLATMARAMKLQMQQAEVILKIDSLPDCLGDATQINQVFSNFLENAVKYLEPNRPGMVWVWVALRKGVLFTRSRTTALASLHSTSQKFSKSFTGLTPEQARARASG